MTDRFDEMARVHNAQKMGCITVEEYAAFGRAQHWAGQEAMRERAVAIAEIYEPRCDVCPSGITDAIRALPIEDTP